LRKISVFLKLKSGDKSLCVFVFISFFFVTAQACHYEPPNLFFGGEAIPKISVFPMFNEDCFTRCGTLVRNDIVT